MAIHVQRKKFDHPQLAYETAHGFDLIDAGIPGLVKVTAEPREIDGEYWVYVICEGDLVEEHQLLLPDYEAVLVAGS